MRIPRIIVYSLAVVVSLYLLVVVAPRYLKSPYFRFVDKDQMYYAKVARACDLMLEQNPLGTNEVVHLESSNVSVPSIIRSLRPSRITISRDRVHVIVGVRDFGMSWEAQDGDRRSWALKVYPEGPERVLYSETKP